MAYWFSGLFIDIPANRLSEVLAITGGVGRKVKHSAPLTAVCLIDQHDNSEPLNPLTFPLYDWSRANPKVTVVYVFVECHGGNCDQAGFVVRGGAVVHVEPLAEAFEGQAEPLGRLLRYCGIELRGGYFEPLTRGYFQQQHRG